jgi:predicted nucleic acid-binding protein
MARYAIDAPTVLHLLDSGLSVHPDHQLVAPSSLRSEALQLLLRDVRAGARSEREALERHERLTELKMRLLGDRVSRRTAWQLAVQQDWETLRDAEHLAVAQLQADALVSVDPALVARAEGIVPVSGLEALLAPG